MLEDVGGQVLGQNTNHRHREESRVVMRLTAAIPIIFPVSNSYDYSCWLIVYRNLESTMIC